MSENTNTKTPENDSSMFKFVLSVGVRLFAICFVTVGILAVVNQFTKPRIDALAIEADNSALKGAVPEADTFSDVEGYTPEGVVQRFYAAGKDGQQIGYCVKVAPKGFGGDIIMMVGIDREARITGISLVSMSETAGVGTKTRDPAFLTQFIGKTGTLSVVKRTPAGSEIEAISGATISSKAIASGVQAAMDLVKITEGGN